MRANLRRLLVTAPALAPQTVAYKTRVSLAAEALDCVRARLVDRWMLRPLLGQGIVTRRLNLAIGVSFAQSLVPQVVGAGGATETPIAMVAADYSEAAGWSTDGSTKCLSTGLVLNDLTGGLQCYLRTAQASSTTARIPIGRQDGVSVQYALRGNRSGTNVASSGATSGSWGGVPAIGNPAGSGGLIAGNWQNSRRGPTDHELFLNGASVGTNATSVVPASAVGALYVMCLNNAGTPALFLEANSRVAGYSVIEGMTAAAAAAYNTVWHNFQTVFGRRV